MALINTKKNRKATPNEIAKAIILDVVTARVEFINEHSYCEGLSDKEIQEVFRHALKHEDALIKKWKECYFDMEMKYEY